MMPGLPLPGMGQPGPEAEPADASRRGKPKRRRFNFNVLENLEKMVQSRPAEPATTTGWTPPAQAAPPAAPVANPSPAGTVPAGTPVPPVAQPESTLGKDEAAPTLPFLFEARSEPAKGSEPQAAEQTTAAAPVEEAPAAAAETPAWGEPDTASADEESIPSTDESAETVPVPAESPNVAEAEPDPESKPSMRSMMFGEEIGASIDAGDGEPVSQNEPPSAEVSERATEEPAPAPEAVAEPPAENESSWPSYPWTRRGEATASEDAAETPASDKQAEAVAEAASDEVDSEPAIATPTEASVAESDGAPAEATAEETGSDQPSTPSAAGDGDKPSAGTLVIIEDDQTAASYYATLFKGNGYQVEVANDGVSGVDLCARVQPQVILLDVMMPRQNGILVLQTLRASDETKNTPVVVMSNFSEPTLIKRALQLGALEYVIKTQVEGPALLNALPRWMNREKAFAAA
jgi:CheY-like chemotaxis protein